MTLQNSGPRNHHSGTIYGPRNLHYEQENLYGNQDYERALWKCKYCHNQDTEIHLLWCPQYKNLREKIDLNNDSDLCQYLQEIYKQRSNEDNE